MSSLAMQAGGRSATGVPNIPAATEAALRDASLSAGLLPQLRARPTLLADLLTALLEQVVNESSMYRMLDDAANAIFVLILCEQVSDLPRRRESVCVWRSLTRLHAQDRFRGMVAELVRKQDDPALRAQLEQEFQQLMTSNQLQMENTRAQRAAFRRNMQRFVEVRPLPRPLPRALPRALRSSLAVDAHGRRVAGVRPAHPVPHRALAQRTRGLVTMR